VPYCSVGDMLNRSRLPSVGEQKGTLFLPGLS